MKKLALLFLGLFIYAANVNAQVDDRAVIPVAVTLNSILRLNVTSGGNIEFNFNTLEDYQSGINTGSPYQTKFNVASSVNWDVFMYAEDANLIGTDEIGGGNVMTLDNIGYHVSSDGTIGTDLAFSFNDPTDPGPLTNIATTILVGYDGTNSNAGDINQNNFTIHWRCGTQEGTMNAQSILEQTIAADRYATNVFLMLQPN
jgi:hypothetical protein